MKRLDNVICERNLRRGNGADAVVVRISAPSLADASEWHCHWQIEGLGESVLTRTMGSDAIHAPYLTLEAIRMKLEGSGEQLTWEGGESGDPGFPRLVPVYRGQVLLSTALRTDR